MREFFRSCVSVLKEAFSKFRRNDPLILASSTAFFTTFAIIPILFILTNVLSLYFKNQELKSHFADRLEEIFGKETGTYLQSIISNLDHLNNGWIITIGGLLFLIFVATNLLTIVKRSINRMWSIKRKHVNRLRYTLSERIVALAIIFITAVLLGVSILLDTTVSLMNNYLRESLPSLGFLLIRVVNILISLIVVTTWFTMLFKILPDAKLHWRVAGMGGVVTAFLFSLGKWALAKLLVYSTIANVFGASASMALILLFIFYSSLILYFGAAFTHVFGAAIRMPVLSGKYSEKYEVVVVDESKESVSHLPEPKARKR